MNSRRETTVFERSTPLVQGIAAGDTPKIPSLRARAFMTKDFPLLDGPKIITKFRGLEGKELVTAVESGLTTIAPGEGSEDLTTHLVDRFEGSNPPTGDGFAVLSRPQSAVISENQLKTAFDEHRNVGSHGSDSFCRGEITWSCLVIYNRFNAGGV